MNKSVDVTAPISSLINDLQDISSALAMANTPDIADAFTDDFRSEFPPEAWRHIKRVTALSQGTICSITQVELDRLIFGYTRYGLLITEYQASISAVIYRRPDLSVIAMSVGDQHFCNRDLRPNQSPTLYVQTVGRAKRPQIQWTPDSLPLLSRKGGAGEGASNMNEVVAALLERNPNALVRINTGLFTEGLEVPSIDADGEPVLLTFRNADGSEAQL